MPTLNSIFPFLEAVCPELDPCWHIRRGRLLRHFESIWAVFRDDKPQFQSITFDFEEEFGRLQAMKDSRFIVCLVPKSWIAALKAQPDLAGLCKLRKFCSCLISTKTPGAILKRGEFVSAF